MVSRPDYTFNCIKTILLKKATQSQASQEWSNDTRSREIMWLVSFKPTTDAADSRDETGNCLLRLVTILSEAFSED